MEFLAESRCHRNHQYFSGVDGYWLGSILTIRIAQGAISPLCLFRQQSRSIPQYGVVKRTPMPLVAVWGKRWGFLRPVGEDYDGETEPGRAPRLRHRSARSRDDWWRHTCRSRRRSLELSSISSSCSAVSTANGSGSCPKMITKMITEDDHPRESDHLRASSCNNSSSINEMDEDDHFCGSDHLR